MNRKACRFLLLLTLLCFATAGVSFLPAQESSDWFKQLRQLNPSVPGKSIAVVSVDPFVSIAMERRIYAALRRKFDRQIPCRDLAHLEQILDPVVPVHINDRALDDYGLHKGIEIGEAFGAQETVGAGLRRLLRPLELQFEVTASGIEITTPDCAEESLRTRIYDVTPIVLQKKYEKANPENSSEPRRVVLHADYNRCMELLQTTIMPDSWEMVGGPGTMSSYTIGKRCFLVISTTTYVHIGIDTLLNQLNVLGYPQESK